MNALITGSSRGIGRAIAVNLAKYGGKIVINYLQNEQAAQITADLVIKAGGKPIIVQADVRSESDCKKLAQTLDNIDVLVHNAAIGSMKPLTKMRLSHWDLTLESSLRPFYLLTSLCKDKLNDGSSIIGISSMGSKRFIPGYGAMGAAKAGVEALTRQLAVELAPKVRVNTVCGGLIDTDTLKYLLEKDLMIETAKQHTPLGRIGSPEDIANTVELLISPKASFITGQIIVVDGGLSLL